MNLKKILLLSAAAFALASGFAISAPTFQPNRVSCSTCHNNCDVAFDNCLAAGTSYTTCSTRARLCRRGCGCPTP